MKTEWLRASVLIGCLSLGCGSLKLHRVHPESALVSAGQIRIDEGERVAIQLSKKATIRLSDCQESSTARVVEVSAWQSEAPSWKCQVEDTDRFLLRANGTTVAQLLIEAEKEEPLVATLRSRGRPPPTPHLVRHARWMGGRSIKVVGGEAVLSFAEDVDIKLEPTDAFGPTNAVEPSKGFVCAPNQQPDANNEWLSVRRCTIRPTQDAVALLTIRRTNSLDESVYHLVFEKPKDDCEEVKKECKELTKKCEAPRSTEDTSEESK